MAEPMTQEDAMREFGSEPKGCPIPGACACPPPPPVAAVVPAITAFWERYSLMTFSGAQADLHATVARLLADAIAAKDAEIVQAEQRVTALRARLDVLAEECEYRARHQRGLTEQVAALTEERDRETRAFATLAARLTFEVGEKMALTTAHAALREALKTGVKCICRRYEYVGTRVCWRCAALAAANKEHR